MKCNVNKDYATFLLIFFPFPCILFLPPFHQHYRPLITLRHLGQLIKKTTRSAKFSWTNSRICISTDNKIVYNYFSRNFPYKPSCFESKLVLGTLGKVIMKEKEWNSQNSSLFQISHKLLRGKRISGYRCTSNTHTII